MNRSVMIIQPKKEISDQLSRIFSDWGDSPSTTTSLKTAGDQLKLAFPDILIIDITLMGEKWASTIPTLKKRFQRTNLIFTYSSRTNLPQTHAYNLVKWQVLTLPVTEKRLCQRYKKSYLVLK